MQIPGLPSVLATRIKTHNFLVLIDGEDSMSLAGFTSVQGLSVSLGQVEIPEPALTEPRRFPGDKSGTIITLVRGLDFNRGIFDWIEETEFWLPGKPDYRKNASIQFIQAIGGDSLQVARAWDIYNCFPTNWSAPALDANTGGIAFESGQIVVERIAPAPISASLAIHNLL